MLLLWRSGVPKIIRFGPMAVNANSKQVTNTGDEVMVTIDGDENPMGCSMSPSSRQPYLVTFISSQFLRSTFFMRKWRSIRLTGG